MNNYIYKIKGNTNKFGIYFFSFIKCENKNIPVIIADFEVISQKFLSNNNKLKSIEFGNTKYINKDYGLAIIEIKENKNNKINFIELDDYLYKNEAEIFYNNESIYIIHKNNKNDLSTSFGVTKNIINSEIIYSGYPISIPKNSPIFNLSNNKLIGVYNNSSKHYNKGIFFKFFIDEFIREYKISKSNEIDILIDIDNKDIGKEIYFLDNYEYTDQNNKNHFHDNLTELNELNAELYIFNNIYKYQKFFVPPEEGEYNIKLKFKTDLLDFSYMFAGCKNIKKIKFINFYTKNALNMKYMFYQCENINFINLFSFDTKFVVDMSYMFSGCFSLDKLDFSSFNTKNVINMSDMFSFCESLENLDLSYFDFKNVSDMSYMFYNCSNLKNLYLFSFNNKNDINMDYMYELCTKLKLSKLNIQKNKSDDKYKNENEISILIRVYEGDINKKICFLEKSFSYNQLNELNTELYIDNIKYNYQNYFIPKKQGIYNIKLKLKIILTNCSYMFNNCQNIIDIKFIFFDTKNVFNMENMFSGCINLTNLDLSSFNTKNVTKMLNMFSNCKNLISLDLSSFNTKNVMNMSSMFEGCKNLTKLNLSSFDTKNVTDMSYLFYNCHNLIDLNISSFRIKNDIYSVGIYNGCQEKTIDEIKAIFKKFDITI